MHKTIIADTSCFILLANIGELDLLHKAYGQIITTTEVAKEFGDSLPEWVELQSAKDKYRQQLLEMQLDKGEASAIALALEIKDSTIILDDYKARRIAEKLGLDITGTLGVIIKAKKQGLIPAIKPYIQKLKTVDFRLTIELEKEVLKEAGE